MVALLGLELAIGRSNPADEKRVVVDHQIAADWDRILREAMGFYPSRIPAVCVIQLASAEAVGLCGKSVRRDQNPVEPIAEQCVNFPNRFRNRFHA